MPRYEDPAIRLFWEQVRRPGAGPHLSAAWRTQHIDTASFGGTMNPLAPAATQPGCIPMPDTRLMEQELGPYRAFWAGVHGR
jgi:hypothetical protein